MRFCPRCANSLEERLLEGEHRPRLVCDACGFIFYLDPKVVAGTIPVCDGRVYLLRRGIEPRKGTWTYPAGFVEIDESVEEAALRETREETNLEVELTSLLNVYSRPEARVVIIVYNARVAGGEPRLSSESLEVASFAPEEIPWKELAFPTTEWALRDWLRGLPAANGQAALAELLVRPGR